MLYFPQLRTSAIAQLPLSRAATFRTLLNVLPDGDTISMADNGFAQVAWHLGLSGLTSEEASALTTLFQTAEGKLNRFTFIDPIGNLLSWSGDLSQPNWLKDPLLKATACADAFGGNNGAALSNSAQVCQWISQSLSAPGELTYAFSAYLRSDAVTTANLSISGDVNATAILGNAWQRCEVVARGASGQDLVFAVGAPAGQRIQVCGLQAEAQSSSGPYKATTSRCGLYPNSRFDQDELQVTTTGPGEYSCNIRIVSRA